MFKQALCLGVSTSALLFSSLATANLCTQGERLAGQANLISFSSNQMVNQFDPFASTSKNHTAKQQEVSIDEYGSLELYLATCNESAGSVVHVKAQRRENMKTLDTQKWIVYSDVNICDPNVPVPERVVFKDGLGAKLVMKSKKNRESSYTFKARSNDGTQLTLFANKTAAVYE